jgi:hypothetical protein
MDKAIDGLYHLIKAESKYSYGDRLRLFGGVLILSATTLGLLWLAFIDLGLGNSWLLLLVPSLLIGVAGLFEYLQGSRMIDEALDDSVRAWSMAEEKKQGP